MAKASSPSFVSRIQLSRLAANRIPMTDVLLSVQAVTERCSSLNCSVIMPRFPTFGTYRRYIEGQRNMVLIEEHIGLSSAIQGAVIKKRVELSSERSRNVYFVYISPIITKPTDRLFVIAHEIGHVALHGKILHPGMVINRRHQRWYYSGRRDARLMELEANLFAMLSLIPQKLIHLIDAATPQIRNKFRVQILHQILETAYGDKLDIQLIKERLLIHHLVQNLKTPRLTSSYATSEQQSYPFRRSSWLLSGPPENRKQLTATPSRGRFDDLVARITTEFNSEPVN